MESDPIEDSPAKRHNANVDSDDEYGSSVFDEGTATLLLQRQSPPAPDVTSPDFSSPAPPRFTQPTQLLDATPLASSKISRILIPGTSPLSAPQPVVSRSPLPVRLPPPIAPPGTNFRPPVFQPTVMPSQNTQSNIFSDSEEDHLAKDDSDDELGHPRADIPPTIFRTGASQVGEDSLAAFRLTTSQFHYDPSISRKRPADDSISAYAGGRGEHSRPTKQHAPSRARPVELEEMDLDDEILDWTLRKRIEDLKGVFPQFSTRKVWEVFLAKRQNYNDALEHLSNLTENEDSAKQSSAIDLTQSDDEISIASHEKRSFQAKQAVKRRLEKPNKSLIDKYSHLNRKKTDVDVNEEPEKPKRRLIKGRRNRTPEQSSPAPREASEAPEPITIDSEASASDDVGYDAASLDQKLLELINTCAEQEFMDIANCSEQHARIILSKRPFKSLRAVRAVTDGEGQSVRTKGRGGATRKRPLGERLVDVSLEVLSGLEAVDRLVAECQSLGVSIKKEMKTWGLKESQSSDELTLASLDDTSSDVGFKNDSGVGTPRSSPPPQSSAKARSKSKLLQQPTNMSAAVTLKDYQLVGLNWLHLLWSKGISGILADEMGLGKTCQVISFLSHLLEIGVKGPHLVVCPSSTLENWVREFHRFAPELAVEVFHGSKDEREELALALTEDIHSVNVVVTTYDIARKKGSDHYFLRKLKLQTAIFDEGHMLKNSNTERYRMLMNIPARWRLLMTGTPLQNNLQELVSVLAFMMPDLFSECQEDLLYIFKHKAKASDEDHAALLSKQRISRARSMMAPFVLRRRKEQVLQDLPAKHTRIEYCDMTPVQKEIYDEYAEEHQRLLALRAAGEKTDVVNNHLMLRRQAAIHPLLFRRHFDDATVEKMASRIPKKGKYKGWSEIKTKEWFEWYSDFQLHELCEQYPELRRLDKLKGEECMDSGKAQKLVEILKKHATNGDRTLLFSQFTTVLDILEVVLANINVTFSRIDGAVNVAERQDLIDQFAHDESIQVFMLSTKAGGTGINLACANKVVIFDSSFNPHDDIQAENRAHRIGQKREVEIIRLITRGTIEEQIHALGNSKLLLDLRVSADDETGEKANKKAQKMVEHMLLEKTEDNEAHEVASAATGDLKDLFAQGLRTAGVEVFS